jgi:hypothetical protein
LEIRRTREVSRESVRKNAEAREEKRSAQRVSLERTNDIKIP